MVDSSSKYLTFILQATKEVQEKAGEIKTLKSQIHSLTEQVSHLEANKSQVITNKIANYQVVTKQDSKVCSAELAHTFFYQNSSSIQQILSSTH